MHGIPHTASFSSRDGYSGNAMNVPPLTGTEASRGAVIAMRVLLLAAIGLVSTPAAAGVVTVNADEFPKGNGQTTNVVIDGFRFSPNCHFDVVPPSPDTIDHETYIGIDGSGCGSQNNTNFLGSTQAGPVLYIDAGGRPFSLEELEFFGGLGTLTSSKGGTFSYHPLSDYVPGTPYSDIWTWSHSFTGGDWTGIRWLLWDRTQDDPGAPDVGFVRMTFHVPEPSTWSLAIAGLTVLGLFRLRPILRTWHMRCLNWPCV